MSVKFQKTNKEKNEKLCIRIYISVSEEIKFSVNEEQIST